MAKTTTVQLFKKPLQFVVEATEGTTPAASPAFTVCPPVKSLSIKKDGNYVDVAQIGPEDLAKLVQGMLSFETQITFYSSATATDEAFFQRCIQAANYGTPAGTISETFTIAFSYYLNGVEFYELMKGTRAKSVNIKGALAKAHEITVDFIHMDIIKPISTVDAGLTTPIWVTAPNAGVIHEWLTGGTTPVTVIGTVIDCTEINVTINRNTSADYTMGNPKPHSTQPHGRRISGDFKHLHTAVTMETNYETPTTGTVLFVLATGVSTLTITNAALVSISRDSNAEDTEGQAEAISIKGVSCTFA